MHNNLTAKLGQLLIDADNNKIAPNAVADLTYELLCQHGIDDDTADRLSDCMQDLAQFVEPPKYSSN